MPDDIPLIDMHPSDTEAAQSWPLRDYCSPGLRVVRPDAGFPHMRPGDSLHHPWKYLRRDVPHVWYADDRYPLMGFLNRDEATVLHNIALQFAGRRALEIGSWLGWSTCHLALAGVTIDVIDPVHDDPAFRAIVEESLARCGVVDRVNLIGGRSPERIAALSGKWSLFFIDGDHEAPGPVRDTLACLPYAAEDCAFVFHDLASPAVAAGLRLLADKGFHIVVYQTAQIMGMAWRGNVKPIAHLPDPEVAWQVPVHLGGLPISGVDFKPPAPAAYWQLREVTYDGEASRPSVCIVTNEIIGPFKNGGIGTSMTGLAETLAAAGMPVTILYTGNIWSPDVGLRSWRKRYAEIGIELAALTIQDMNTLGGPVKDRGFGAPWLVYRYLAEHPFDVIHFNDCCGEGSLSLAAKKLGLAFADSLLVVALHSPSRWVLELNQTLPSSVLLAAYHYAEKLSVACAEVLWSPSRYLLDWVAERGFELPVQTFVQQYAIPENRSAGATEKLAAQTRVSVREIVFFGRLEERKGLRLFCNAIHLLRDELVQRGITVTFLGKPVSCAGMPSLDYIARRSVEWKFPLRTLTDLGQPEALRYLAGGDKLAVMASPFDNSPCTVYEALSLGIPFLASRTGGIPELIAETDRDHVLFEYSAEALGNALRNAIEHGGWIAKPSVPQDDSRRSFVEMHAHWRMFLPARDDVANPPASVAAIIDHRAGARLDLTLQSLSSCPSVHRFVILNRSGESLPLKNIDLLNEDTETIEGELTAVVEDAVLLIHSGVTVVPHAFDAMLQAMGSAQVDGLIPAGRITDLARPGAQTGVSVPGRIIPPLGGSAAFSLFEGVTFTGAMLVQRGSFSKAREGRALSVESPFLGLADFCVARCERIWPYAEPVVERAEDCRFEVKSALPARVAAYGEASPNERYYMLAMGYGAANHQRPIGFKRELAMAAVSMGLGFLVRIGTWGLRHLRMLRRWMG